MGEGTTPAPPTASPFIPQPPAPGAPPQGPAPVQGQPVDPPPVVYQQPPPVVVHTPPTVTEAGGYAGYRVLPPRVPPQPGMVIVAWEICEPEAGCCLCETLSTTGWIAVALLVFFCLFWLAWIPCLIPSCHQRCQRPVYGWPGQAPYPTYPGAPPPLQGAPQY